MKKVFLVVLGISIIATTHAILPLGQIIKDSFKKYPITRTLQTGLGAVGGYQVISSLRHQVLLDKKHTNATYEYHTERVVKVFEPTTYALVALAGICALEIGKQIYELSAKYAKEKPKKIEKPQ